MFPVLNAQPQAPAMGGMGAHGALAHGMGGAAVKSLKRCANHVYIAHLIHYHQRMSQQANLMQGMGGSPCWYDDPYYR